MRPCFNDGGSYPGGNQGSHRVRLSPVPSQLPPEIWGRRSAREVRRATGSTLSCETRHAIIGLCMSRAV